MPGRYKDLTGQVFAHWTIIARQGSHFVKGGSHAMWLCRCVCGAEKVIKTGQLRQGKTTSCGCQRGTHRHSSQGGRRSPTYGSWQNMIARCTQPSNPAFAHYQKRGITVCDRWRRFENFLADMGERPGKAFTVERIDNDGHYEPGNCRWATRREQANNRMTNVKVEFKGVPMTIAELAREAGVCRHMLYDRLIRGPRKWTVEEAITTPAQPGRRDDTD